MRLEKKFALNSTEYQNSGLLEKLLEFGFVEQFFHRTVNSIYFDKAGLDYYHDHVFGAFSRHKVRYRWYGRFFGSQRGQFEIKGKVGEAGWKRSTPLDEIILVEPGRKTIDLLTGKIQQHSNAGAARSDWQPLRPFIATRYRRRYFAKPGGLARVTIDEDIQYAYCVHRMPHNFLKETEHEIVVEVKTSPQDENVFYGLFDGTGLSLDKNSKYIKAVSCFF